MLRRARTEVTRVGVTFISIADVAGLESSLHNE